MPPTLPELPLAPLPPDAVELGRIGAAWGIRGWFRVAAFSPQPNALMQAGAWHVQLPGMGAEGARTRLLPVAGLRTNSRGLVACSPAVPDRTAAEALRGARIFVPRSQFAATAPDEYYQVDLLGLEVLNRQGLVLGRVRDFLGGDAQTTLVVRGADGSEHLIPFVAAYIDRVDMPARRVHADWQPDY